MLITPTKYSEHRFALWQQTKLLALWHQLYLVGRVSLFINHDIYVVQINIRDAYRWAQPNLCSFLYFQEQRQVSDHKILRNYPNWRTWRHWTTWGSKPHLLSHEIPCPCEMGERKYGFPLSPPFPVKKQGKELKPFSQYNQKIKINLIILLLLTVISRISALFLEITVTIRGEFREWHAYTVFHALCTFFRTSIHLLSVTILLQKNPAFQLIREQK